MVMHVQLSKLRGKLLSGSRGFYKNKDKFGWVKYWRMMCSSPNSPKFSPANILRYTVYMIHIIIYCIAGKFRGLRFLSLHQKVCQAKSEE